MRKVLLRRGRRGALEIGLVALVCALGAGAVIGSGLAQTVLATPSPLTWLRNNKGQVVQVNPETGTMLQRLQVGNPGDPLKVVQDGSRLVVTNLNDGTVTVVDLSMLRVSGVQQGDPEAVKVVLTGGQIYLVDKVDGQISALDPLTAAPVGQPYQAGAQLTDVVADSTSTLWALTTGGRLVTLRWSDRAFSEQQRRDLAGVGPGTALVAHQRGITAVTPAGLAIQVGTGQDRTVQVGGLTPPLAAAEESPTTLVPVSTTEAGTVHLVRDNGAITVDGPPLGCAKPDKPAVYRDRVYVPCRGDRKVIVLDQDGHRSEPDLSTQGDAELVLNAGLLFVNVPTGTTSLVVKPDGTTQRITTDDPKVTVNDPNARPTALPSGLGIRPPKSRAPAGRQGQDPDKPPASRKPGRQTGTQPRPGPGQSGGTVPDPTVSGGPGVSPSGDPLPDPAPDPTSSSPDPEPTTPDDLSASPTGPGPAQSPPPPDADYTPSGVDASTMVGGNVAVFWTPPRLGPDSYEIRRADTDDVLATPEVNVDTAVITGPDLQQVRFIVVAVTNGRRYRSVPSGLPSPLPLPGAPTVSIQLVALSPASFTVRVTVGEVPSSATYGVSVTVNGTSRVANRTDMPASSPTSDFTFPCTGPADPCLAGGSVTADASITTEAGTGPPASTTRAIPAPPQFQYDGSTMLVSSGGKCLDGSSLTIRTCDGSPGQFWSIRGVAAIRNPAHANQCLSSPDGLHWSNNCNAPPDDQRWDVQGSGNLRTFRNQDTHRCLAINGSPAAEGAPAKDLGCQYNNQDTWYLFTATLPLTASAQPASFTLPSTQDGEQGGLGEETVALLLLPLAAGLVRSRQRRQRRRPAR